MKLVRRGKVAAEAVAADAVTVAAVVEADAGATAVVVVVDAEAADVIAATAAATAATANCGIPPTIEGSLCALLAVSGSRL